MTSIKTKKNNKKADKLKSQFQTADTKPSAKVMANRKTKEKSFQAIMAETINEHSEVFRRLAQK